MKRLLRILRSLDSLQVTLQTGYASVFTSLVSLETDLDEVAL